MHWSEQLTKIHNELTKTPLCATTQQNALTQQQLTSCTGTITTNYSTDAMKVN